VTVLLLPTGAMRQEKPRQSALLRKTARLSAVAATHRDRPAEFHHEPDRFVTALCRHIRQQPQSRFRQRSQQIGPQRPNARRASASSPRAHAVLKRSSSDIAPLQPWRKLGRATSATPKTAERVPCRARARFLPTYDTALPSSDSASLCLCFASDEVVGERSKRMTSDVTEDGSSEA
jgi:hypothetical protein